MTTMPFQEWSNWVQEGWYLSFQAENIRYWERVKFRDLAHYVLSVGTVESDHLLEPAVPDALEVTTAYDEKTAKNEIWQVIFGIKGQVYVYVELPTDAKRHGLPKEPWPRDALREVAHFEEWMSPFLEPSFLTEHWMMRPGFERIHFIYYNPEDTDIAPRLNIFIAKLITDRVGREEDGELFTPVILDNATKTAKLKAKWQETLEKLYKGQIPCKYITLAPVTAPAVAH